MRIFTLIMLGLVGAASAAPAQGMFAPSADPSAESKSTRAAGFYIGPTDLDLTEIPASIRVSDNEIFRRFGPESDAVSGHVHFRSPDIMSGLREDRAYGDDPEGSLWLIPVNWDARTGSLIPIQAIFGELPKDQPAYGTIAKKLREALIQQVWNGAPGGWAQAIDERVVADPMALSVFTFIPSTVPDRIGGIAWHFEPETVAPRSKGVISIIIPQERIRDVIRPEWREMFAGEPSPIPPAQQMLEAERVAEAQRPN